MGVFRPVEGGVRLALAQTRWFGSRLIARQFNPAAIEFFDAIASGGFEFDDLIKLIPSLGIIYIVVPKVASTRIKLTLAEAVGRHSISLRGRHRFRGPRGPSSMTITSFHRLATDPKTLRFSFVRNPYARAVSCWADKWQDKPLVRGDDFIDDYLARRHEIDAGLPAGPGQTLSFAHFVTYASALAHGRVDAHLQTQHDILDMPGIKLDFIGRMEQFSADFARVLDHIGAADGIRGTAVHPVNVSRHGPWMDYYTPALRDRVYRAYERDFDLFRYPRGV
jgi:hypothetical protein